MLQWVPPDYNSPHQCPKCLGLGYIRLDGTERKYRPKTVMKCWRCKLKWRYKPNNPKRTAVWDYDQTV